MKPEAALQCACWVYAQQVLPENADYAAIETKVGRDDMRGAAFRKMLGIRAGEPDARLIWRGMYHGIEFKAGSSVSDAQHKRHAEIRRAGGTIEIVRSVRQIDALFRNMGIPLRHHSLTAEVRDEMLATRQQRTVPVAPRRQGRPSKKALRIAAEAQRP